MDLFYNFYDKKSKDELIRALRLAFGSIHTLEQGLAEILGYPKSEGPHDPNGGQYITGEYTPEMLLDQLKDTLKRKDIWLTQSKCPGYPHQGHASSDWSCPLDR